MSISPHEDQFLEEVFGLFVLEAQEWLAQCKTALQELERNPPEDREAKLYETLICGVSNLGGSAATVELPTLEKLAFAIVPLLQRMRELGSRSSAEQGAALRAGLDKIAHAIEHLEETKSGALPDLEPVLQRLSDAERLPAADIPPHEEKAVPVGHTKETAPGGASPVPSLFDALRDLERSRSHSAEPVRHVVDALIKQVKGEASGGENGAHSDASVILQILEEQEIADEQFLQALHRRLPTIEAILAELKSGPVEPLQDQPRLAAACQDIHLLHESARALDAKTIMLFFHGLQTFLGIVSRKEAAVLPQRIESVASRLRAILPMAEHWVDLGRRERATVKKFVYRSSAAR